MLENDDHGESARGLDPALDGTLADGIHRYRVRVYHADTDMSGAVYHARYLEWLERGRSDLLRAHGVRHSELSSQDNPQFWVVRRMEIDYLSAARIEEALEVSTQVADIGKARIVMAQTIGRGAQALVKAVVTAALINARGRPQRLDRAWQARFATGRTP